MQYYSLVNKASLFIYSLLCYITIYSLLLAMTLADEDEKRFEREKEWEDFKTIKDFLEQSK